jgi:hypothetical protein
MALAVLGTIRVCSVIVRGPGHIFKIIRGTAASCPTPTPFTVPTLSSIFFLILVRQDDFFKVIRMQVSIGIQNLLHVTV